MEYSKANLLIEDSLPRLHLHLSFIFHLVLNSLTSRSETLTMQSAITISKTEFSNRQEIVEDVATFLKISREELSLESRDKISTVSYLHFILDFQLLSLCSLFNMFNCSNNFFISQ